MKNRIVAVVDWFLEVGILLLDAVVDGLGDLDFFGDD